DWVRAEGTTLGADNGIGVATIMSILAGKDLPHPAIEALFTIDEETGMTGALGLKGGILRGELLLNLDTENDHEIDIGCAGGIDVTATRRYREEPAPKGMSGYTLRVTGLKGGHSGMDIHKGLGNANKIMNRLLYGVSERVGLRIARISGGSLRNAIPRESEAGILVPLEQEQTLSAEINRLAEEVKFEFRTTEPSLAIHLESEQGMDRVMNREDQEQLLRCLYAAHNGVYRMSADIHDLVETSNNVAKVTAGNGEIVIACLTRSSLESSKMDLALALKACFELGGCGVEFSGAYPGWTPNVHSPLLTLLISIYEKQHGTRPEVVACHAGLECGILGRHYPGMDMISFGPTILGAHSPDERVSVSSVQKYWNFVTEILKNIPLRQS
ncbi:MAG: beta-Ala-His dipeptidase, partial [Bacteroidia bacterium]|nr:beta-Ala-His dipeptidase [Bacteroidia bacterium]